MRVKMVHLEKNAFEILAKIIDLGKWENLSFSDFQKKGRVFGEHSHHKRYSGKTEGISSNVIISGLVSLVEEKILLEKIVNGVGIHEINPKYLPIIKRIKAEYPEETFSNIKSIEWPRGKIISIEKNKKGNFDVEFTFSSLRKRKPIKREYMRDTLDWLRKSIEKDLNSII